MVFKKVDKTFLQRRNIQAVLLGFLFLFTIAHLYNINNTAAIVASTDLSSSRSCFVPQVRKKRDGEIIGKPYLNMGFPKMGSSSLQGFWNCGGLHSSHYQCGHVACGVCFEEHAKLGEPMLESCPDNEGKMYDSHAEMNYVTASPCYWPQHERLLELHQEAPNATFVITFRNMESWIDSVSRWTEPDGSTLAEALVKKCGIPDLEEFFCDQVNLVRDFVEKHPSHTLIEVKLEDEETANIMEDFFGIQASCWRKLNVNPK